MATDFFKKGPPKMGWDFTAESRGALEGARVAKANAMPNMAEAVAKRQRALEEEQRQADAQDATYQAFEDQTVNTFYKDHDVSKFDDVNLMWEDATNGMIDTYHNIVKNKDLSGREKALATDKLMRYVPLVKNARNILSQRMQEWDESVVSDSVSSAFPAKFQQAYTDLKKGDFDGGIVIDGDNMYFRGKTSQGEEINLPLQDFERNLPGIMKKGISYTDSVDGQTEVWDQELAKFKQTGKESDRPVYNRESIMDAMEEGIGKNGEKGDMIFAMDTMGLTREEWDGLWNKYYNITIDPNTKKPLTDSVMTDSTIKGLAAMTDDEGNPKYTPEQLERLKGKPIITTEVQAKQMAIEELLGQYADGMKVIYDTSNKHYGTATPYSDPSSDKNKFNARTTVNTSDVIDILRGQNSLGDEVILNERTVMRGMDDNYINSSLNEDGILKFTDRARLDYTTGKEVRLPGADRQLNLNQEPDFKWYWMQQQIKGGDGTRKYTMELEDYWDRFGDEIFENAQKALKRRKEIADEKKAKEKEILRNQAEKLRNQAFSQIRGGNFNYSPSNSNTTNSN
tara:strand:- start:2700 stop:4403 length:1704 start_codon:yes stop_codon:yes gene_type:complete